MQKITALLTCTTAVSELKLSEPWHIVLQLCTIVDTILQPGGSVPCRRMPRTMPQEVTEALVEQALSAGGPRQRTEQQLERLRLQEEGTQMLPQ